MRGSTGHAVDLMRVAYSDDGTRIVSGAADGAVGLWDAETCSISGRWWRRAWVAWWRPGFVGDGTTSSSRRTTGASDRW